MFASLKPWINVPYQIKPVTGYTGAGTKQYGTVVNSKCYPKSDVTVVTNEAGIEVTSTTQLYVDGAETIKVTDVVVFEGSTRPIHRINTFYRNGTPDIKVVYL